MNQYIKNIHINKLYHLNNFDIPINKPEYPHLLITGKNGSGKTVLLNAVTEFLDSIKNDTNFLFTKYEQLRDNSINKSQSDIIKQVDKVKLKMQAEEWESRINKLYGKVNIEFCAVEDIIEKYSRGDFVIAMYKAYRKPEMSQPKNPTKPEYKKKGKATDTATSQFLNFLSDLRIQEALARNENQLSDAETINEWFTDFENLLKQIYQDNELKLEFNYKNYSFLICTEGKKFGFTEVSDGFSAVLEIVADLILKMQDDKNLTRNYQKNGIVLIDEIETHLHLGLQKIIMPLLTEVFPNIQFIVTTHSPFILSSMPNAVAFDLDNREILDDLTEYSYEALAEGYFGVKSPSSYAEMQLDLLRNLLDKEGKNDFEIKTIKQLIADFEKISEAASPLLIGEFRQLLTKYANQISSIK